MLGINLRQSLQGGMDGVNDGSRSNRCAGQGIEISPASVGRPGFVWGVVQASAGESVDPVAALGFYLVAKPRCLAMGKDPG
jgi:hypothetical protein